MKITRPITRTGPALTVRPSVPEDIPQLAPRLREEDLRSVLASSSASAMDSLMRGLHLSNLCLTAVDKDGCPQIIFGTVPFHQDRDFAHLWFLGSREIDAYSPALLRQAGQFLATFHRKYPILAAYLEPSCPIRRRWLRACGFKFASTETINASGHIFEQHIRVRNSQCATLWH